MNGRAVAPCGVSAGGMVAYEAERRLLRPLEGLWVIRRGWRGDLAELGGVSSWARLLAGRAVSWVSMRSAAGWLGWWRPRPCPGCAPIAVGCLASRYGASWGARGGIEGLSRGLGVVVRAGGVSHESRGAGCAREGPRRGLWVVSYRADGLRALAGCLTIERVDLRRGRRRAERIGVTDLAGQRARERRPGG